MTKAWQKAAVVIACVLFTGALGYAVAGIAGASPDVRLAELVQDRLAESGVQHPITAVLLNFRSYDTLLEIAVLVIAGIAGISMSKTATLEDPDLRTEDPLLYALQRWFVPLMLLLAGYLLWAGADRPGGAFQAGALLAGTGVLMRLGGVPIGFLKPGLALRVGLAMGFAVFLLVAVISVMDGRAFLAYPPDYSKSLILIIETVLTLSIGLILLALFVSAPVNKACDPEEGDSC